LKIALLKLVLLKLIFMAFLFSKFFRKTDSEVQSNDTVDAIIEAVGNQPYAVSDKNVLLAGLNELGGYFFFQSVVVGTFNVKSKIGAQLAFKGIDFNLQLDSDSVEFESEHTDVKGRFVTKIDFQIEESEIEKLKDAQLNQVSLKVKNQEITFNKYIVSDEEE
jgi:hypothetical protein